MKQQLSDVVKVKTVNHVCRAGVERDTRVKGASREGQKRGSTYVCLPGVERGPDLCLGRPASVAEV